MDIKTKRKVGYIIATIIFPLWALLSLKFAYVFGARERWLQFGLSLLFCLVAIISFLFVQISFFISKRLDNMREDFRSVRDETE